MDTSNLNLPNDPADEPVIKKRADLYAKNTAAADIIRQKLETLYNKEPETVDKADDGIKTLLPSRHQQYMNELSTSGKSLVSIQDAWHQYYNNLSDLEKHEVWQEFYAANHHQSALLKSQPAPPEAVQKHEPVHISHAHRTKKPVVIPANMTPVAPSEPISPAPSSQSRTIADIKKYIVGKVRLRGKLSKKQHVQSLLFGLMTGALVVIILLFGFFNERFIAPFITPSRNVSATPLILDPNNSSVDPSPQVIIPKINVQAPVVYDVPTINEDDVQAGLERGIVHYAITSNPGEQGNAVFFGHSSSNILNRGKYKFAFVLLSWLDTGDTFYLQKGGVRYVYKVYDKRIVKPTDVSVLNPIAGHPATATLITCDPPGTNVNRLIVIGDQISPDPNGNSSSTAAAKDTTPKVLAGNSVSLWHRIIRSVF